MKTFKRIDAPISCADGMANTQINVDVCLSEERKARTGDYALAILTAKTIVLDCREQNVVDALETHVPTGAPGLLGTMLDPNMSEAYGSLLVESKEEAFEDGLHRLWNLLRSQRSESSSNYRLAVEYGIARLVFSQFRF